MSHVSYWQKSEFEGCGASINQCAFDFFLSFRSSCFSCTSEIVNKNARTRSASCVDTRHFAWTRFHSFQTALHVIETTFYWSWTRWSTLSGQLNLQKNCTSNFQHQRLRLHPTDMTESTFESVLFLNHSRFFSTLDVSQMVLETVSLNNQDPSNFWRSIAHSHYVLWMFFRCCTADSSRYCHALRCQPQSRRWANASTIRSNKSSTSDHDVSR